MKTPTGRVAAHPVTWSLIGANVLVYLATLPSSSRFPDSTGSAVFRDFALFGPLVAHGEYWRLLTSGFLHFGLFHVGLNMYALWLLGTQCERILGSGRLLAVYLLSLLGGALAVLYASPDAVVAGASGAVFGLMGGYLVIVMRLRLEPRSILIVIGLNVLIGLTIPGISLAGHLGGLVVGIAATAALIHGPALVSGGVPASARERILAWGLLAAIAVVIVALLVLRIEEIADRTVWIRIV